MKEKDKNDVRFVMVKITPKIEDQILLRVPKGVAINQMILENSGYFDDWWEYERFVNPNICGSTPNIKFSQVLGFDDLDVNELGKDIPTLDEDGIIE